MICRTNGRLFKRIHVWFEPDYKFVNEHKGVDEIVIHGSIGNEHGRWVSSESQYSLISDLSQNEDELLSLMTKTYRNEIRRAGRENINIEYYESDDIFKNSNIIKNFSEMYSEMYKEKGMKVRLGVEELNSYAARRCLLISVACYCGKPLVYHSYIYDGKNSRFLHSCSNYRISDNAEKNMIGRANKYLHFMDFKYLKDKGITTYDWGGCAPPTPDGKTEGIDKFKRAFGGQEIQYYNVTYYRSVMAKLRRIINKKNRV